MHQERYNTIIINSTFTCSITWNTTVAVISIAGNRPHNRLWKSWSSGPTPERRHRRLEREIGIQSPPPTWVFRETSSDCEKCNRELGRPCDNATRCSVWVYPRVGSLSRRMMTSWWLEILQFCNFTTSCNKRSNQARAGNPRLAIVNDVPPFKSRSNDTSERDNA